MQLAATYLSWGESSTLIRPKIRPLPQVLTLGKKQKQKKQKKKPAFAYRLGPKTHGGTSLESRVLLDLHYIGHIHPVLQRLSCWAASLKGPFLRQTCRLSVALRAALGGRSALKKKTKKNKNKVMVEEGRWSSRKDVINSASDRVGSPGDTIHIVVSSWVPGRIILKNLMDRGIKARCTSVAKLTTALPALTILFSRKYSCGRESTSRRDGLHFSSRTTHIRTHNT